MRAKRPGTASSSTNSKRTLNSSLRELAVGYATSHLPHHFTTSHTALTGPSPWPMPKRVITGLSCAWPLRGVTGSPQLLARPRKEHRSHGPSSSASFASTAPSTQVSLCSEVRDAFLCSTCRCSRSGIANAGPLVAALARWTGLERPRWRRR